MTRIPKTILATSTAMFLSGAAIPALAQQNATGGQTLQSQPATGVQQQQTAQGTAGGDSPPVIALSEWNYDDLYANGWSLEELIDEAEVYGVEGDEIGNIENVLIDADGQILSVVAEVGGWIDIGDTHVAVPWDQVEVAADLESIRIPVDEDNLGDYSVYGEWGYYTEAEADTANVVDDDLATGPRVWKATDLLDDYALLSGNMRYGYVRDLIFTGEGQLHAVVVNADPGYGGGNFAYPFYGSGYGWNPRSNAYGLPYGRDDITVIDTFDYGRLRGGGNADSMTTGSVGEGAGDATMAD